MNDDQKMGRAGIEPATHGFSVSEPNGTLGKFSASVSFGLPEIGVLTITGTAEFASRMMNAAVPEFIKVIREAATAAGQDPDHIITKLESALKDALERATREGATGKPIVINGKFTS